MAAKKRKVTSSPLVLAPPHRSSALDRAEEHGRDAEAEACRHFGDEDREALFDARHLAPLVSLAARLPERERWIVLASLRRIALSILSFDDARSAFDTIASAPGAEKAAAAYLRESMLPDWFELPDVAPHRDRAIVVGQILDLARDALADLTSTRSLDASEWAGCLLLLARPIWRDDQLAFEAPGVRALAESTVITDVDVEQETLAARLAKGANTRSKGGKVTERDFARWTLETRLGSHRAGQKTARNWVEDALRTDDRATGRKD
jgi:hypothetical protein